MIGKCKIKLQPNRLGDFNAGTIGADSYSQFETRRQAVGSNNAVNGSYTEIQRRYEEINSSILLSINKNLTEDIGFGINFGGNSMSREYRSTYANLPALELPNLYTLTNLQSGSIAGLREPLQTSPSRDAKNNIASIFMDSYLIKISYLLILQDEMTGLVFCRQTTIPSSTLQYQHL